MCGVSSSNLTSSSDSGVTGANLVPSTSISSGFLLSLSGGDWLPGILSGGHC